MEPSQPWADQAIQALEIEHLNQAEHVRRRRDWTKQHGLAVQTEAAKPSRQRHHPRQARKESSDPGRRIAPSTWRRRKGLTTADRDCLAEAQDRRCCYCGCRMDGGGNERGAPTFEHGAAFSPRIPTTSTPSSSLAASAMSSAGEDQGRESDALSGAMRVIVEAAVVVVTSVILNLIATIIGMLGAYLIGITALVVGVCALGGAHEHQ